MLQVTLPKRESGKGRGASGTPREASRGWQLQIDYSKMHPTSRDIDFFKQVMSSFNRLISTYPQKLGKKKIHIACWEEFQPNLFGWFEVYAQLVAPMFQYVSGASCSSGARNVSFRKETTLDVEGIQYFGKHVDILGDLVATMLKRTASGDFWFLCLDVFLFFLIVS